MADHSKHSKKKAALLSAIVCGVIGPGLPVLARAPFAIANGSSFRDGLSRLPAIPVVWAGAILLVGPVGFLLGTVFGVLLQVIAQKLRSKWSAIIVAVLLGLGFGSAVPVVSIAIGLRSTYDTIGEMADAAPTGAACGLLVLWLLQRTRLLDPSRLFQGI